jgi:aspartate/methionine/tyrosine aminotransferase
MNHSTELPPMASTVIGLEPEGAYRVLARAQALERAGKDVIHLEIGESDFATDNRVCQAGIDAIGAGHTRYNPTPGITSLRQAIADDVGRRRRIVVHPQQVVVGPGAKPHLFFPTMALVEAGDEVIYPDPGFPTYEAMIRVAGGTPVPIPLSEEKGFSFDLDALRKRACKRTRMIVLNSPSNPTGGVMPMSDLAQVAQIARKHDCWILSDEIYSRMCYDGVDSPSIASLEGMQDRTIIVDGFSKTYAMTGWRLGYGVMPQRLAEKVSLLMVHAIGCTAEFTQYAGIEALTGPQDHVAETLAHYKRRRDVLVAGLNAIPGVRCQTPAGAFYAFPNVRALGRPSSELADMLLDEAGVALLPGTAFGPQGEGFLRLCYANSTENLETAVDRIRETFSKLTRLPA